MNMYEILAREEQIGALFHRLHIADCRMSRVEQGVSTEVYKLTRGEETAFLRIGNEKQRMSTEVAVHELLLEKGVHVPEVEAFEDMSPELGSSYMIVKDIGGQDLETQSEHGDVIGIESVLTEAGKDLARINSVPVSGFGKIMNDTSGQASLGGEYRRYDQVFLQKFDGIVEKLVDAGALESADARMLIEKVSQHKELLACDSPVLAHGDLDMSHIFSKDGKFTGVIDFGGMRGASPYYDLAYFRFRHGAHYLPNLIEGYQSVAPLDKDYDSRIQMEGLIIAVQKLKWALSKGADSTRFQKAKRMLSTYVSEMTI